MKNIAKIRIITKAGTLKIITFTVQLCNRDCTVNTILSAKLGLLHLTKYVCLCAVSRYRQKMYREIGTAT